MGCSDSRCGRRRLMVSPPPRPVAVCTDARTPQRVSRSPDVSFGARLPQPPRPVAARAAVRCFRAGGLTRNAGLNRPNQRTQRVPTGHTRPRPSRLRVDRPVRTGASCAAESRAQACFPCPGRRSQPGSSRSGMSLRRNPVPALFCSRSATQPASAGVRPSDPTPPGIPEGSSRVCAVECATLGRRGRTEHLLVRLRPLHASNNGPSLFSTWCTVVSGSEQTNDAPRAFQSMLLTWSDRTTPDAPRPSGSLTSKG